MDKTSRASGHTHVVVLNDEQMEQLHNFYKFPPTDETVQGVGEMLVQASKESKLNEGDSNDNK